jgi:hypothetical protein
MPRLFTFSLFSLQIHISVYQGAWEHLNVIQLIYRGTTKTLLAQNGDNSWACMLQGKAYDYNMIECLV